MRNQTAPGIACVGFAALTLLSIGCSSRSSNSIALADSNKASPAAPAPSSRATADGHTYRMKLVKVMDSQGFERPLVSATMLIPTDWQFQGATTWNIKDACNTIRTVMQASGPDGTGFEIFPAYSWIWADDPTFLRQSYAQQAAFGIHACDVMPPMSATEYIKSNLKNIRPDATLAGFEPAPKLMESMQAQARQAEQMAARFNLRQQIRPDAIRARIKYSLNGKPVEEWIYAAMLTTATTGPVYDVRALRFVQAASYSSRAYAVGARAPQGKLDSSEKLFELLNSTFRIDPQWQARVTQGMLQLQQIQLKGARDRSNIISKNADDIRRINQESFENQQRAKDQAAAAFSQTIRGVETYQNPNTGERVELDSAYGNAWVNNKGEYLLTDQAGLNPNVGSVDSWTQLERAKPEP